MPPTSKPEQPQDQVNPFADLVTDLNGTLRAKLPGSEQTRKLRASLQRFVEQGWQGPSTYRQFYLMRLGTLERGMITALSALTASDIRSAWAGTPPEDPNEPWVLPGRLKRAAERAGERLVAMRIAGEEEPLINVSRVVMSEQIQAAYLVSLVRRLADQAGLSGPDQLAPALFGAVSATLRHKGARTPIQAIKGDNLLEGHRVPPKLEAMADVLNRALAVSDGQYGATLEFYNSVSREIFRAAQEARTPSRERLDGLSPMVQSILGETPVEVKPDIGLQTLVAFEANSRDGTAVEARVAGAHDLLQRVVSAVHFRDAKGVVLRGESTLASALSAVQRLGSVIPAERAAHKAVKSSWVEIEEKFKMEKQKNPETTVYPVVDKYTAPESRALYYQNAVSAGIPLGHILSELYDSTTLSFGPTEREYFERVAFYAARKYAANFVAEEDERVTQLSDSPARVADIQMALRQVEEDLRRVGESMSDDEIRARGRAGLDQAVQDGALRRKEVAQLLGSVEPGGSTAGGDENGDIFYHGIVEAMITRIRAAQEVRALTALLAVHRSIPRGIIQTYTDLPHTQRYATIDAPETRMSRIKAKNGQSLYDFERVTRARWFKYRQQAPAGRDVEQIHIPGSDAPGQFDAQGEAKGRTPFNRGKPVPGNKSRVAPRPSFDGPKPQGGGQRPPAGPGGRRF